MRFALSSFKWLLRRLPYCVVLMCWKRGRVNSHMSLSHGDRFSLPLHQFLSSHLALSVTVSLPGFVHFVPSISSIGSALGVTFVVLFNSHLARSAILILVMQRMLLWSDVSQAQIFTIKPVAFVVNFMRFAAVSSTGLAAMLMLGDWCSCGWMLLELLMVVIFPSVHLVQNHLIRYLVIVHPIILAVHVVGRALVVVANVVVLAMLPDWRPL